jgi:basic membrane protein A
VRYLGLLVALLMLLLGGCTSKVDTGKGSSGASSGTGPLGAGVAIVFDKGGVGDKSFNDSADRGRQRIENELGLKTKTVPSRADIDYKPNLEDLARLGYKLIFAIGGGMQTAISEVAPKHPDVMFVIIDGDSSGHENVIGVHFKEEEGSFLAGALAGLMTKTNKLGFVGGMKIPLIEKFEYGYRAGVFMVNRKAEVVSKYTEDWDNVARGKEAALACRADGADIVYHAAGKCGLGVFDAAEEKGFYAIGVDSNQDGLKPGIILTSMIKSVDNEVFRIAKEMKEGKLKGGDVYVGLKEGGVGLTDMEYTKELIGEENLGSIDGFRGLIIDGIISVPKTKDVFEAFKKEPLTVPPIE